MINFEGKDDRKVAIMLALLEDLSKIPRDMDYDLDSKIVKFG